MGDSALFSALWFSWFSVCLLECQQASESTADGTSDCRAEPGNERLRIPTDSSSDSRVASGFPRALPSNHPWVHLGYKGAVLSTSPLVVKVDNFMSEAECEAVIAAMSIISDPKLNVIGAQGDYTRFCEGCGTWFVQENDRRSGILGKLEERIGHLIGSADHGDEAAIQVTSFKKQRASMFNKVADAYILHHDKVSHPRRIATVLIPLRNLQPHEGGHTIFPAAQLDAKGDVVRQAFANITPPLGNYFQINRREYSSDDKVGLKSPQADAEPSVGAAREAAEASCRDAADGTPSAVATPAQAGTAVVWYHELGRDREVDPMAWHAGCFVRAADVTRWTLQKFKESPAGPPAGNHYYLPKTANNVQTLAHMGANRFKVLPEQGLAVHWSKSLQGRDPSIVLVQHQIFSGTDEGEWVKIEKQNAVEPPEEFYNIMEAHNSVTGTTEDAVA